LKIVRRPYEDSGQKRKSKTALFKFIRGLKTIFNSIIGRDIFNLIQTEIVLKFMQVFTLIANKLSQL